MKLDVALKTAEALVGHLRPVCTRIEIAGSIRREKGEVKDIEIVAIPDMTPVKRAPLEFGKPVPPTYKTQLDKLVDEMKIAGDVRLELNGNRYKKFWLNYAGIKVDLFINVPPSQWGVQMVIRTGPEEFSHWVVSNQSIGGALPDPYFVKHQVVWIKSEIGDKYQVPREADKAAEMLTDRNHIFMHEEIDFFRLLGMDYVEPKERVAKWRK